MFYLRCKQNGDFSTKGILCTSFFKVLQKFKELLEHWLIPQLQQEMNNFIFQQDEAPPHWHRDVRACLNHILPIRWIGQIWKDDLVLNTWPLRSPDLTPCDFFLWGLH